MTRSREDLRIKGEERRKRESTRREMLERRRRKGSREEERETQEREKRKEEEEYLTRPDQLDQPAPPYPKPGGFGGFNLGNRYGFY